MGCHLCDDTLDHCHEPMVVHNDGIEECSDPKCHSGEDVHEWFVSCIELGWSSCYCSRTGHTQPLAA